MIKNIIDLLQVTKGETENIRIAQGKYKLAESFKEMVTQIKQNNYGKKCSS
tara:strand:- start:2365 stop:2517 length:153 start_codon:yes stop_codon:yes gene_type:complete